MSHKRSEPCARHVRLTNLESGVQRVSERHIARIASQGGTHLAGDVGVTCGGREDAGKRPMQDNQRMIGVFMTDSYPI